MVRLVDVYPHFVPFPPRTSSPSTHAQHTHPYSFAPNILEIFVNRISHHLCTTEALFQPSGMSSQPPEEYELAEFPRRAAAGDLTSPAPHLTDPRPRFSRCKSSATVPDSHVLESQRLMKTGVIPNSDESSTVHRVAIKPVESELDSDAELEFMKIHGEAEDEPGKTCHVPSSRPWSIDRFIRSTRYPQCRA